MHPEFLVSPVRVSGTILRPMGKRVEMLIPTFLSAMPLLSERVGLPAGVVRPVEGMAAAAEPWTTTVVEQCRTHFVTAMTPPQDPLVRTGPDCPAGARVVVVVGPAQEVEMAHPVRRGVLDRGELEHSQGEDSADSIGLDFRALLDRSVPLAAVAVVVVDPEVVTMAPLVPTAMVLEVVEEPAEESHLLMPD